METFSALLALCAGNSPVTFVRGIHRSPVNSPHKGHWRGALMFSLICAWNNSWANNGDAGDLRRHGAHYVVIVMPKLKISSQYEIDLQNFHTWLMIGWYRELLAKQTTCLILTHWGWDKMATITQTTFSNALSWIWMFDFRLEFH